MAIMLNSRSNVYENIFSSASQPPDSSTILQPAGIADGNIDITLPGKPGYDEDDIFVTITGSVTRGTGSTCQAGEDFLLPSSHTILASIADTSHTFSEFTMCDDSDDETDETFTVNWWSTAGAPFNSNAANCGSIASCTSEITIRDNDPTVASLARVGSGAVTEGGKVEFTVTLGRALVAGETIDVPLSISGTGVTTGDWSLGRKSGTANTGVGLRDVGTSTPKVRFSGAGAQTATLELTPTNEGTTEGAETFTIALGSNTAFDAAALGTDVGGGADPHGTANAFTVVVNDGVAASLAANPSTVREGGVSFVTVTGFPSSWGAPRIRSLAGATTSLRCDHADDGLPNPFNTLDVCVGLADGTRTGGHWDGVAYRLTLTVVADGVAENERLTVTFEDSTDASRTRTSVIALDDRSPLPFISLEAVVGTNPGNVVSPTPHAVTEGGAFNLRVKMDPWFRLATPVTVNYYLADYHGERVVRGPSLTDPKRDRDPNPRSIAIAAGHSATVINIPTVASPDLDGDSKVEVILLGGRDYATSTGKLTLTVQDADPVTNMDDNTRAQMLATPSTLTLGADAASVTEGGEVTFTVTADPAPGYDLPVHLGAAEEMGAGLDYIGLERARTVTIPAGVATAAWTVTTWSDDKQRADGTVEARIKPGDGYTAGTPSTVTVALLDDDAPAVDPSLVAQVGILAGQTHHGAAHVLRWRRVLVAFGVEAYPGVTAMTVAQAEANARRYSSPLWPRIAEAIAAIEAAGSDPAPQQAATQQAAPAVDPALVALVRSYAAETHNGRDHVERWMRVLAAFGEDNGRAPMTAAEARTYADRGWTRWDPVVVAIAALEAAPEPEPQPVVPPAVSVAAGEAVSEGGGAVFTLTAAPAPASPLAVAVTVGAEGDFGIAAGARTVTVPTGGRLVLTLATVDDGTDEPDGSVSVTLNGGDGYTVGSPASGAVAVADDDLPPPVVSVTAKAGSITEGAGAVFTVTADRAPDAALAVRLTVSEAAGSDFVAAGDEGGRTVTIPAGTTGVALTVATDDDAADEPDGSVSAAVDAGAGYTVAASPGDTASVAVADNDAAATGASLSVDDATVKEGAGLMWFTLRLSAPSERAVRVSYRTRESSPVSARQGRDYLAAGWHLYFQPGETEKRVWVWVYDDSHDEDPETFEFVLTEATVVPIADGVAVGTIVNDDPLPAAFLARFGRTVAEQALDGIAGRMAAPRTPGMQGTVAGQALNFDPAAGRPAAGATPGATPADRDTALAMADIARGFGADASAAVSPGGDRFGDVRAGTSLAQSRSMTARDALLGSSFSLTGAADGSGGSLAFWGRAAQGGFDGREGTFSLDGAVTTGMLGADYARGRWLVGLALAQSAGEGDYRDTGVSPRPDGQSCPDGVDSGLCGGAVRAGDGEVEASLTAAIPYAALQASERLKLWGAAGYGTGEVTLKTALGGSYSSDTSWSMAAAGLRGELLAPPAPGSGSGAGSGSGPALAVTSDALWTRTSSEKTRDLAASESDATRLRLGLEGSWRFAMEGGGSLVPKLEVGARHDGGDAETGFGVELGGGIRVERPGARSLARRLGPHAAGARERRPEGPGLCGLAGLRSRSGDAAGSVAQPAPGVRRTGQRRAGRAVPAGDAGGPHGRRGELPLEHGGRVRLPGLRRALDRQPACRARALYGRARLQPRLAADAGSQRARLLLRPQGNPQGRAIRRRRSIPSGSRLPPAGDGGGDPCRIMATGDGATAWACLKLSRDYRAAWNGHAARPRYEEGAPFPLRIRSDADRIAERDWGLLAWEDPDGDAVSAFFAEAPMLEGEGSAAASPLLPLLEAAGAHVEGAPSRRRRGAAVPRLGPRAAGRHRPAGRPVERLRRGPVDRLGPGPSGRDRRAGSRERKRAELARDRGVALGRRARRGRLVAGRLDARPRQAPPRQRPRHAQGIPRHRRRAVTVGGPLPVAAQAATNARYDTRRCAEVRYRQQARVGLGCSEPPLRRGRCERLSDVGGDGAVDPRVSPARPVAAVQGAASGVGRSVARIGTGGQFGRCAAYGDGARRAGVSDGVSHRRVPWRHRRSGPGQGLCHRGASLDGAGCFTVTLGGAGGDFRDCRHGDPTPSWTTTATSSRCAWTRRRRRRAIRGTGT